MKVCLIGRVGRGNAEILAIMLRYYNVQVDVKNFLRHRPPDWSRFRDYDVTMVVGLGGWNTVPRAEWVHRLCRIPCILLFVGSDAYELTRANRLIVRMSSCQVAYVSDHLRRIVGVEGPVVPIPVDTKMFTELRNVRRDKDVLYYLGIGSSTYRPEWIRHYIREHPSEKITVLSSGEVPYEEMPRVYNQHKSLIRMTTHDGYPKMPYEAFFCGCEVWWNGTRIREVPSEMRMENTIPEFIEVLGGQQRK